MKNYYNFKNHFIALSLMLLSFVSAYSQTQFTVVPTGGTAGNTNGSGGDPICRFFNSIRFQVVYTVAELNAAGMSGPTQIDRLAWNVTESSVSLGNYTISMGHTAATNSAAHNVDATTTVKTPFTYSVALGYNDIIFDTPFTWNGSSNIVVEICTGAANPFSSPYGGVESINGITSAARYYRVDGTSACATNTSSTVTTKPLVRFTGTLLNPAPATLTQAPGIPTCSAGSDLSVSGTPLANNTWYWQTSATGTSTALPYTGPYTVLANGTYYIRSFNSVYSNWSNASSIVVSNFPVATPPLAAVATTDPSCVPLGSSLSVSSAPAGYEYYWQGTNATGSSNALPATTPYAYTASGTYYVAAYETASGCWSNGVGTAVTVNSTIPASPVVTTSAYNYCSGVITAPISATVPTLIVSGTCAVSASASGNDNTGVTATVNNFTCAPGTITGASLSASIGTQCPNWYYYSIVVNGVTVATTQCNQSNFNLTPYLPLTSVSIVSENNPADSPDFVTMNLTVDLSYTAPASPQPAYTLSWYDASTSGNMLGTSAPFETIGTSVLPAATNGSYNFYVQTELAGCSSAARQLVTVNVTDVNATLTPINVTCNGGNNGSFALGTVQCGTAPFTYSVNGGAYGPIPTDLVAGTYSIVMQDVNGLFSAPIQVVLTQPAAPANVAMGQINYYTADVSWTTTGNETQWNVEVGPAGFTPGTGTSYTSSATSYTLPGLTEDTDYDVYISAICGPNPELSDVVSFSTNPGFFTFDNQCGPGYNDISATGVGTDLFDDNEIGFTLPWTLDFQGTSVTQLTIGNNGGIIFNTLTGNLNWTNTSMTTAAAGLYPYWDDLLSNGGAVYTEIVGTAPNRSAIIQWNVSSYGPSTKYAFQVVIEEATDEIYYIYDNTVVGDASYDNGVSATIGVAGPLTDIDVSLNNTSYLLNNSCAHFYNALCPNPTNMVTTVFQEEIDLDWTAGAYGETDWTVIYGPVGFDPATSGTILTTSVSAIQITGLTQVTEYDIYIYSECTIDNLTSDGFLVNAVTLPWCPDPITLNATSEVDSILMTWDWIPAIGATNGGISSFNIEYGQTGYNLYSGTEIVANGVDFADTIDNAAFLPGQVIDVYVQSVCGVDSSNYVGPFTIVMPLSNDTVCGAEELMVDGTVYIFNNTGATVTSGETGIVPSQTGYNATELPQAGWGQPTLQRTTWFTFTAPASGSIRFSGEDVDAFWSQIAIYDAPICNDFNTFELLAASDQATVTTTTVGNTTTIDTFKVAPNFTICGLTPGNTYYIMHDSWAGASGASTLQGEYSIAMTPITLEAGTFVDVLDACTGTSVVLFDGIAGYEAEGTWTAELAPAGTGLTDSLFNTSGLGYQVFDFEYRVTDGCAYDSIVAQVQIFPLSSAGTDGTITVCRNEPVDLLSGLGGNVDLGGSWYNPSNQLMPSSSIYASNIPGQFNYDYITGNGVCPDDTANVLLTVGTCNWANLEEMYFSSMTLLPNPTNGLVYITNEGNSEVFNYDVIDIDGRVIASKANAINGASTTTIDLTGKVTGMYMIRVYNGNAEKVFRVVLQ